MRRPLLVPALFLFFMLAMPAYASVRINEIAWMGTKTSANNEWIELYNDATGVTAVDGWFLKGKDGSPSIALKGNISPGGYYLIERSNDAAVPNIDADLTASFGRGLSNEGETLIVTDASGTPIDTVIGGSVWVKIGGNNNTKETAQRTGDGWITGIPTPRAENIVPPAPKKITISAPVIPKTSLLATTQMAAPVIKEKIPAETKETHAATGTSVAANILWEKQDSSVNGTVLMWISVAIGLFILATILIMRSEVGEPTEADKYAIIEDIIEGDEEDAKIYLNKAIWDE